jgi:signal transduction histidine kinase
MEPSIKLISHQENTFVHSPTEKPINTPQGEIKFSFKNKIIRFCKNCEKILGFSFPAKVHLTLFANMIYPEDKTIFLNIEHNFHGQSKCYKFRMQHPEGGHIWVECVVKPTFGKHQNLFEWTAQIKDITQEESFKNQITYKAAEFNALMQNATDAIWSVDSKLNLTSMNKLATKFLWESFGLDININANIKDAFLKKKLDKEWKIFYKLYTKALNGGREKYIFHYNNQKEECLAEFHFNPILEGPDIGGVVVFVKNITDRYKELKELNENRKALESTQKELNAILYQLSHHLISPLLSLKGVNNLIKIENQKTSLVPYLEMTEACIQKMEKTYQDMTLLENLKHRETKLEEVNLEEILNQIQTKYQNKLEKNGLQLSFINYCSSSLISDRELLKILHEILLDNAINFARDIKNKNAEIELYGYEHSYLVRFYDNGHGIDPAIHSEVFNMFFRGTQKSKGSGLGLYLAKNVVEKLHGVIQLNSDGRSFTEFNIILPKFS